ncbi:MAG TPA: Gfo/Idh/MocA family oxidoreductase [Pseudobacteroides sp.]|uniref:Gfo/Idh/MocA family protein n=1 Tax=Pseudobacteroides sp. TaxID=1968840 RepID=UPI002F93199E
MTTEKIKWGILGYARIAKNHVIPAILKSNNSILYGIATRDPEKLKECQKAYNDIKAYDNYQCLLDDPDIQAVYIPLPNGLHKEWVIKAARKGKHILCEKPISISSSECIEMIEECRKNNVKLMEAFMYRYTIRTKKVLELIESNIIGQIKHIYSTFSFLLNREDDYRWDISQGGGALFDIGCYPLNFIGMILKTAPISMTADYVLKNGVDSRFSAILKYPNDIVADISCGFDGYYNQLSQITGTLGNILIPDTFSDYEGKIIVRKDQYSEEISVDECERYLLEVEDFADSIICDRDPLICMDETLRNIKIIEELLKITYRQ